MQRILCGHGGKECENDPGVYPKPVGRRLGKRPDLPQGIHGSVYRQQEEAGKRKQPLKAAACNSDAMVNPQNPKGSASTDPFGF